MSAESAVTVYGDHVEPIHRLPGDFPAGADVCAATSPGFFSYSCTEPKGHDGDHYADGITRLCAQWPAVSA